MTAAHARWLARLSLLVLAAGLAAAAPGPSAAADRPQLAQGQAGRVAVVNTMRYEVLDTSLPIKVVTSNDTDLNLRLRDRIVERLEGAYFDIDDRADLELSVDSEVIQGSFEPSSGPSLGSLGAGTVGGFGRRSTGTVVEGEINVWSSGRDSVFGGRKSSSGKRTVSQYRVFVILENRRSATRIWEGDVRAPLSQSNPERLAQSMVVPLIDSLGETLRHETVELP